jgi:TubC N-terminal docking domain
MSSPRAILDEMFLRRVKARVEGQTLRLTPREALDDDLLARIREHKPEIIRTLAAIPPIPAGVHLISWNLKNPPVTVETCAIVTDTLLFARRTIEQLRIALGDPTRWVGWTVSQLIDRLAQVGVSVALD